MTEESKEIKRPSLREKHTAENTTMKESVNPALPKTVELEEGDVTFNILLGTSKANFEPTMRLALSWARYQSALTEGKATKAEITRYKNQYEELAKEQHPGKTEEELEVMMSNFLSFHRNLVELPYFRNPMLKDRPWENLSIFADGKEEGDIVPRFPGAKNEATALAERMQRSSQRKSRTPNGYDVLMRDSFIQIRLEPSSIIELGQVIDKINKEIHGYVSSFNGNSMTLIRASIYRVFWNYISEKITSHSVSDVDDPRDLTRLVKLSDIRSLFVDMMAELAEDGLPIQLYCNQNGCDWVDYVKADPVTMLWHDKTLLSDEQAAALGSLKNFAVKHTFEEVLALQDQSKFVEKDHIDFYEDTHRLEFAQPSLSEYFCAFDVFMDYIQPTLREIRTDTMNDQEYEKKLTVLIDTVRGLEYMHWASKLTIFPEAGSDEEPEVFTRREDPVGFFNGLLPIIDESDDVTRKLIHWCVEHGPEMSSTVVGMSNSVCPKCGKDTHGGLTSHGITPIDPFMSFFILTRQTISDRAVSRGIIAPDTL
ncbi:hypothetical protein [Photobacterium phage PDCC-1]|uniref:Uncharacterized protein n=1 Tax=Photobacterium phage PDCC-1 TaxID=2664246 RepID=A0A6B9J3I7_9CAUD|nr:hypothetical protein HWC77_gp030 [Photobacterium phage PDCC-1]QGZ14393.1 hypothetical protein [Photobacterium phage PDCC-1]